MKPVVLLLLLTGMLACSESPQNKTQNGKGIAVAHEDYEVFDASLPLHIADISQNTLQQVKVNDGIEAKIGEVVRKYYTEECMVDSTDTSNSVKDVYIETLQLQDNAYTLFIVLLEHIPGGEVNSKVLFYKNDTKSFDNMVFDFNLHALYDRVDGELQPSNLRKEFNFNFPEIEKITTTGKYDEYRFTRLYHNGTANLVETTVLKAENGHVLVEGMTQEPVESYISGQNN